MIEPKQIRAARALLGWSQTDLAKASGIAVSSIKNIENSLTIARKETIEEIASAFEKYGVEFMPNSGVRLMNEWIKVNEGQDATKFLVDDIFLTCQKNDEKEVCIIGLDENYSLENDGRLILENHIKRLKQLGVSEKIIIKDGDTNFINSPSAYRWLKDDYFTHSSPVYIYGNKVAIHSGTVARRTIVIESKDLAAHMKKIFSFVWDNCEEPKMKTK